MKQRRTVNRLAERLQPGRKTLYGAVAALVVTLVFMVWWTTQWADRQMRGHLLQQARLVMQMISPDHVKALAGNEADLTSSAYVNLKQQLSHARQANGSCRFIYLMGRTADPSAAGGPRQKLFFFVDSEPSDSKDYSPPGQVYHEATPEEWRVFNTQSEAVEGPSSDRWGTWVSAFVPLKDPDRGNLVAVLGMDVDACSWKRDVALYAALPAGLTLVLLAGLFSVLYVLLRRSDRRVAAQQALLRKSEEQLKFAMEGANDGIWEIDLRTQAVALSPRGYEMLGYERAGDFARETPTWEQLVHPDDLPATQQAMQEHLSGREPFFHCEHRLRRRSGEYLWVLARGKVSERDAQDRPVRMTGTHTDIASRKQAERQMQEAQVETARLLAQAQHSRQILLRVLADQKKKDEALKEERLRLASIIQGTNVGTWEWNVQTGGLVINSRWAEMVGYSLEELAPISYDTWIKLVHPDDLKASNELLERHIRGELDAYSCECRMRHKDDRWVWVLDCGRLSSRTADGQPLLVSGMHQDITARKQAEIFRQLTGTVLAIINETDDFRRAIRRILEALQEAAACDAVGMRLQDGDDFTYYDARGFSTEFLRAENTLAARTPEGGLCRGPDGKVKLACTCGLVLAGKTDPNSPLFTPGGSFWSNDAVALLDLPAEQDPRFHPRSVCMQEGYRSLALIPIRTKTGIVGLLQFNARNRNGFSLFAVTALEEIAGRIGDALVRKQAEAEHKRLMAAIEQSGEMILITDARGTIQYVNPAFISVTGYSREEAVGQTPRILKSGQHGPAFYGDLWQTITSGRVWTGRLTNKRKDGTLYTEDASISPVRDETGAIVNYVAVKSDITEHLQISAQLQQAQKMESVGRLAGGVAHDFNNMLAVILGNAELALSQTAPEQPLHADLQEIRKAAERSADLTRQLLAFARKQIVMPKVIDLNDTVAGMLKMLRRLLGENLELAWQPGPGAMTVNMDPSQVDQILANLTVNARDAIKGVGKVTIETRSVTLGPAACAEHVDAAPGDYVALAVSDTGCGMDRAVLEHIFEPFFTTKKVGEGTGLGLATVYGIVKQNHGFIAVSSEPGAGTTFTVHLPRFTGDSETHPATQDAAPVCGGKETVLLVEDEPSILNMLNEMMGKLGYRVLAASTPEEALRIAESRQELFDLLLADMVMPGMSGQVLAERVLALYPTVKCLFMSGYTASAVEFSDGVTASAHFIQKPFMMHQLAVKLREVLDGR